MGEICQPADDSKEPHMANVFFLSYARPREALASTQPLVAKFHAMLEAEVSKHVPNAGAQVGFRDACDIEAGSPDWRGRLSQALTQHPIGVVLLSPDYVDPGRPWCHWEFSHYERTNRTLSALPAGMTEHPPRTLLLLNWTRPNQQDLPSNFPRHLQQVGESIVGSNSDDVESVRYVCSHDLLDLLQLAEVEERSACHLMRFTQALGRYIKAQWESMQALVPHQLDVGTPASFDESLTWSVARESNARVPPKARPSRRMVYVVYLAASPKEVPSARAFRYEDRGESDWRPFTSEAASTDGLQDQHVSGFFDSLKDCEVEKWHFAYFNDHMEDLLEQASNKYPLIFVVDPWTATHLESYRQVLDRYRLHEDQYGTFACPVVIWSDHDQEAKAAELDFEKRVAGLFDRYRWERVDQPAELGDQLRTAVETLQRKMRKGRTKTLPDSGSPLTRLNPHVRSLV